MGNIGLVLLLRREVAPSYSQGKYQLYLIPGVQDPQQEQVMDPERGAQPVSYPSPSTKPRNCL